MVTKWRCYSLSSVLTNDGISYVFELPMYAPYTDFYKDGETSGNALIRW